MRYYVTRAGGAVVVVPADPANTAEAAARVLGGLTPLLELLADPTVLGQAVEAGYVDIELEPEAEAPPDAGP